MRRVKRAVFIERRSDCLEFAVAEVLEVLFETSTKGECKEIIEKPV